MRQQAIWHWLRRDAAVLPLLPGHSPSVDVVDLKAALRHTLGEPLAQQLHSKQDPGDSSAHPAAEFCPVHSTCTFASDMMSLGSGLPLFTMACYDNYCPLRPRA